ncbi:uncharacterized protein LOC120284166 [Dioscorea cayenensis subsp. rotundata]|uniref:Uncharacterized protein LOC120284166 n=1 Tax=Dioscorea cayennensis subsp. rotundata TaxID=55577 RepID=A0AB40D7Y2_DIOCR|nr:uncharacterized protein LOC120284166 [Dioscorea cayenensis subsp. rotundata]
MASTSSAPHFLAPVDIKLNGFNYREWFTTVRIVLLGMDLLAHVDGTSPQPSTPDTSWTLADRRTMTIICQSCEIDVRMEIGHLPTAHAMWEHLAHMFEHSSSARQYAILQDLTHIQQRERSVREYVTNLRSLWHQIDSLETSTCLKCTCCKTRTQSRQIQRTFEFLMHLHPDFEAIRSQLLNRDPLPSYDDVIRSVIAEETSLSTLSPRLLPTDTVLAVTSPHVTKVSSAPPSPVSSTSIRSSVICHYCKRPGNMKHQCLKLQHRQQQ